MFKGLLAGFVLIAVAGLGFIYSGWYPLGADDQHTVPVYWALETLRVNSIQHAAKDIDVPALDDPDLLLDGGPDYNEMCAACHLKPGVRQSDLSQGLYPAPKNLVEHSEEDRRPGPAEQFWVIKHGIKASGMPAWGLTHDDRRIWAMVAFIRKLPELSPLQYQILTARTSGGHDEH